jgi:GH15 family glucan-1,4-alpha-glucosidase
VRDTIHADVCDRGWDPDRNTFTQFYGSTGLDAALLLIPQVGFLPWHDERVTGTVDAVQRELCSEGFLVRYQPQADGNVDGLPGTEGAFITCTFWLAEALYGTGRRRQAHELFEHLRGTFPAPQGGGEHSDGSG